MYFLSPFSSSVSIIWASPGEPRVKRRENLRLAAREQAGAMDAGKQGDFAVDLADIGGAAAVGAAAFRQNHVAELLLDDLVSDLFQVGDVVRVVALERLDDAVDEQGQTRLRGWPCPDRRAPCADRRRISRGRPEESRRCTRAP